MFRDIFLAGFLICQITCASLNDMFNEDLVNKWILPFLGEERSLCRNHSIFFLEELGRMKLWAAEMFDASGKYPNGLLYGSGYALGHYDECLDIEVPYLNEPFFGKYCMARLTATPNSKYKIKENIDFEFGDYKSYFNISAWSKVLAYADIDSKASRNEIYFSFCLPSSCSPEDLQRTLDKISAKLNQLQDDFKLITKIDKYTCQIKTENSLSIGDISFITFLTTSVTFVIFCSVYHMWSRNEDSKLKKTSGKLKEFFICFSIPRNLKKMASPTDGVDGLECLAGIKVISMFLIILGHRCMFFFGSPMNNPVFIEKMYTRFEAAAMLNGPIIVDTFFLISGFLASYFTLCALKDTKKKIHILLIYIHRLIRMTPTYAVVLAFYCTIFVKLGSGPFWQARIGVEQDRCQQNWWANLLYINNYVNTETMCMFQSWYLSCDMHYFLLIPLVAIMLKKKESWGIYTILALIISSIIVVFTLVYINNEQAILLLYMKLLRDPITNKTFQESYIPSHMRASPYFVGMLTGYIKYKMKHSAYKIPKWLYRTGWTVATLTILITIHLGFIFYIPQFSKNSVIPALYAAFHHVTFSAGNAWLIIAVSSGRGRIIEPILSWKPFILLSRITYSAFLCHGAVQLYTAAIIRQPNYVGVFPTFYATFGDITVAYIVGFLLSIFYEAPIMGLEKIVFGKIRTDKFTSQIKEVIQPNATRVEMNEEKQENYNTRKF